MESFINKYIFLKFKLEAYLRLENLLTEVQFFSWFWFASMDLLASNIWYSIFIGSSTVQRFNLSDYQQLLIRQIKLDSSDAA